MERGEIQQLKRLIMKLHTEKDPRHRVIFTGDCPPGSIPYGRSPKRRGHPGHHWPCSVIICFDANGP